MNDDARNAQGDLRKNITVPAKKNVGKTAALVGGSIAAALFALIGQWEGKKNDPYKDIVGIWTVCYGDTRDVTPGQRQTDAQCLARLDRQVADHATPVLACVPGLAAPERRNQLIASVSLAYNIGPNAFCGSTAARRFRAGDWRGGCDAVKLWNKAGGRVVRGLVNRRADEHRICADGL